MFRWFLGVCVVLAFAGCQVNENEFIRYMSNRQDGPWVKVESNEFTYWLQYRPLSYQALVFSKGNAELYEEALGQSQGLEYYYLSLSSKKEGFEFPGPGSRERSMLEGDYGFQALRLQVGDVQLAPVEYIYEPSYNIGPEAGMLMAFDLSAIEKTDMGRTLHVKGPFDNNERRLEISRSQMNDIPNFKR